MKSQTTATALCQPFFTPVGFGTFTHMKNTFPGSLRPPPHAHAPTYPDVALVHGPDPPLGVDAQRALGLVRGHGTHRRRLVRTGHVTGEVTHWRQDRQIRALTGFTGSPPAPPPHTSQSSPSQVQPWRMRPTMRDVQRLHLVGVLKVFTTN